MSGFSLDDVMDSNLWPEGYTPPTWQEHLETCTSPDCEQDNYQGIHACEWFTTLGNDDPIRDTYMEHLATWLASEDMAEKLAARLWAACRKWDPAGLVGIKLSTMAMVFRHTDPSGGSSSDMSVCHTCAGLLVGAA